MAIEEAPRNSGGVQNIRLVIDIGDDRTVEIPLKGKLILQNSGPPQAAAAAAAAANDAAHGNAGQGESAQDDADKEFLMKMRGWLMMVGTLFVTMAFQAAQQPPAWLRTTDFLRHRLIQSEIDMWNHPYHGASHAAAAAAAPARFVPSPGSSPQATESATAGLSRRARAYMYCNYCTFGSSLALVLMLMLMRNIPPRQAKFTLGLAIFLVVEISLFIVGTVVLGTSEDWRYTLSAFAFIELPVCVVLFFQIPRVVTALSERFGPPLGKCIATFRACRRGNRPPRIP